MPTDNKFFRILLCRVITDINFVIRRKEDNSSCATLKLVVKKKGSETETVHAVADGVGPVNAIDLALRNALGRHFPEIANVRLTDFNVREIKDETGTGVPVEVTVNSSDGTNSWKTSATSVNIIEASLLALAGSLKKELELLSKL